MCVMRANICYILDQRMDQMFFFKDFIYLFLERGEGRETERQRNLIVWLTLACPLKGWRHQTFHLKEGQPSPASSTDTSFYPESIF